MKNRKETVMRVLTIFDIGTLTLQCIQIIITGFFLSSLLTPRYSFSKCIVIFSAVVCMGIFLAPANFYNIIYIRQMVYFCVYAVLCRILYKDSWRLLFFALVLMYILVVASDLASVMITSVLFAVGIGYLDEKMLFAGNLIFCFHYLIGVYLVLLFSKRKKNEIFPRSIYLIMLFPISQLVLVEIIEYFSVTFLINEVWNEKFIFSVLSGVLVCILADVMLFRIVLENSRKERLIAQLEMMDAQSQRELTYYTSMNEKIQEIRKIRHDFNNHLQTAYAIFSKGNTEEAVQLLGELEQNVENTSPVYYCSNVIINAILWEKGKTAGKKGIAFHMDVRIPEEIGIEKVDLCSIFSNLLDNAIMAASLCEGERSVSAEAYIKGGYFVLRVENSFHPFSEQKERREEETGLHGYGLLILDSIAEKYQGEFQTAREGNRFRASAILKLQK